MGRYPRHVNPTREMGRWGDGEIPATRESNAGDGEMGRYPRHVNPTREMGRWGDGEMGRYPLHVNPTREMGDTRDT
ncbi:hypothetical protein NDU88_000298 [Pleurodeles waltl]|uniref:Uncharacterized protein n=1 Tax=Pleurodeles waltl TaxID=8319 RepID=A0AAV7KMS1_PLEWA|nr:hypothetical protein NDU88_000298 [Pleurodeles waltl]